MSRLLILYALCVPDGGGRYEDGAHLLYDSAASIVGEARSVREGRLQ